MTTEELMDKAKELLREVRGKDGVSIAETMKFGTVSQLLDKAEELIREITSDSNEIGREKHS